MKRCSMRKKHRVKFKVDPRSGQLMKALEHRAKKLVILIFNKLPCPMCRDNDEENCNTVPHHVLNKGMYNHLRYKIRNLLPLCLAHHRLAHDKAGDFLSWLQDRLPDHYRYRLNEKDNKEPVRRTAADLQDDIDDLQYYYDHLLEAERLIYED